MVNHTKLIRAFTHSSLSNNTKRWLSAYLKGKQTVADTTLPSFHARIGVSQGAGISPILFNFFVYTFPQSDDLLTNFYADDFTVSYSNSNRD